MPHSTRSQVSPPPARRWCFFQRVAMVLACLMVLPILAWTGGSPDWRADAQIGVGCPNPNTSILQVACSSGTYASVLEQFESDGVNEYLAAHGLPASASSVIYTYGRGDLRTEVRAFLLVKLLDIINRSYTSPGSLSTNDQAVLTWFTSLVQQNEIAEYNYAQNDENTWQNSPGTWQPNPTLAQIYGLDYNGSLYGGSNIIELANYNLPVPSIDYFLDNALSNTYGQPIANAAAGPQTVLLTDSDTTLTQSIGASAGAAAATGVGLIMGLGTVSATTAGAAGVSYNISIVTQVVGQLASTARVAGTQAAKAVLSESTELGSDAASEAASEAASDAAADVLADAVTVSAAGPATVIGLAVAIVVEAAIQLSQIQQEVQYLDTTLSNDVNNAQNAPNLFNMIDDPTGMLKLSETFVAQTLPDYVPTATLPTHQSTDPNFSIASNNGETTTLTSSLTYTDWNSNVWTAQTYSGWFVQTTTEAGQPISSISPTIEFQDWSGNDYFASRIAGGLFLIAKRSPNSTDVVCQAPANSVSQPPSGQTDFSTCSSYVASTILLQDGNGNPIAAQLALAPVFTTPSSAVITTLGPQQTFTITATGIPAPQLALGGVLPAGMTERRRVYNSMQVVS